MKAWELLEQVELGNHEGLMSLHRRDGEMVIRVNGHELMNTRAHGSEDALGALGCAALAGQPGARVLIGGLGMGFTLAAALAVLGADAEVVVAELVPEVVAWNRAALGAAAGHPLDDPRVKVYAGDVSTLIRESRTTWDAILLDVDNGPEALTQAANDGLYGKPGLAAARAALRAGAVFGVWSVSRDAAFQRRLERAGFRVSTRSVFANGQRGRRHILWLAEKLR